MLRFPAKAFGEVISKLESLLYLPVQITLFTQLKNAVITNGISMRPRILIIEDDPDIAESIRYNLDRTGDFTAHVALSGEEGLLAAHPKHLPESSPDLIILDLNLPGMSGFELCRRLREEETTARTPIVMVTARVDENDKIRGLELGADDYLTKPFSVRELVARVRAALRRAGHDSTAPKVYDDGVLMIDYAGFTVACEGAPVRLTRKEFALLAILSRQSTRVVPREQLLDRVWGLEFYGEARTLDVHISGLRKKLGHCGRCIETMIGIGYRFRSCSAKAEDQAQSAQLKFAGK